MTTGLTYSQYKTTLAALAVVQEDNGPFNIILPQAITYAENRIYRDLDLLGTVKRSSSYSVAAGSRNLAIPMADFVTVQDLNIILPAGESVADQGTRSPLLPVTKEFLDMVYPSVSASGIPTYFAPIDQFTMVLGPWAASQYYVEVIGTYRPDSLSETNTTTMISLYLPDLFLMASMVFISGYQRNFGRQSDDPQEAMSYEAQYKTLLTGAAIEEARKKFLAAGYTAMSPTVAATPNRGP